MSCANKSDEGQPPAQILESPVHQERRYETPEPMLAPTSKSEFCEQRKRSDYFLALAYEPSNQLAFENHGGIKNRGVCWWHALFQRSSFYTTVYRPDLPKPSKEQAKKIIHLIASGGKIVEVPGYKNMFDFSRDWEAQIQSKLESWQLIDGFLKFAWIKGLSGSTNIEPEKLKSKWDSFEQLIEVEKHIEWSMLQLKGITTHGVLFVGVESGQLQYHINYLDSNYVGQISSFTYIIGEGSVNSSYGPFIPYKGRQSDLAKFKKAAQKYCSTKTSDISEIDEDLDGYPLTNDLE